MAKVTVYDQAGKPHEVDSVDAKEYVASGSYTMGEVPMDAAQTAADEAVRQQRAAASATATGAPEGAARAGRKR